MATEVGVRAGRMLPPAGTLLAGSAALALLWFADPTSAAGFPLPPCPSKLLLGLTCPGCGGCRMVVSLLRGDVFAALRYNALALVFLPFLVWSWSAWALGRWRTRRYRTWEHWRWTPRVCLIALVIWGIARNLPFAPFDSLSV